MAISFSSIKLDMSAYRNPANVASDVQVLGLRIEGWSQAKQLMFRAIMKGKSQSSYITMIIFDKITFTLTKDDTYNLPVAIDGKIQYAEMPNLWNNNIRLYCSCPDFRFRFSKELADVGGLIGNWRRYTKVPGSTRGPVNPEHRLGYCRHIFSLLKSIKIAGYIKE